MKETVKSNLTVLKELLILIRVTKKWWLLPLFIMLAFLSLFAGLVGNHSILPAIYALF